jgi:hypothetical protein
LQRKKVTISGDNKVGAADLGGFDELVVVRIVRNGPEVTCDLNDLRRTPNSSNRVLCFCGCVPELGQKDSAKLRENGWGQDEIGQTGLGGKEAAVRCPSPKESGHQDVGVQNHPHLAVLVEEVVDQPLALFLAHAREVQTALAAECLKPAPVALDEAIQRIVSLDESRQGLPSRRWGQLIQGLQDLSFIHLDLGHASPPLLAVSTAGTLACRVLSCYPSSSFRSGLREA